MNTSFRSTYYFGVKFETIKDINNLPASLNSPIAYI